MCRRRRNESAFAGTCRTNPDNHAHRAATGPVPYRGPRRGAKSCSVASSGCGAVCAPLGCTFGLAGVFALFVCLSPCWVCLYAGLPARWLVRSSGCSFACLQVVYLFVCLFVCLVCLFVCLFVRPSGLSGCLDRVSVLLGSLRPHFWGTLCRCGTSAAQTSTRRARARAGVQVGTHSTHWTLRSMMQANPIITAAGATRGVLESTVC
jgi:hypothetical protein